MSQAEEIPQHLRRYRVNTTTGEKVELTPMTQEQYLNTLSQLSRNFTPDLSIRVLAEEIISPQP